VEHDPARYDGALDWPMRDLFEAYLARVKDQTLVQYYVDVLVWATLAPYQKQKESPPPLPKILKG
jgi:hypothetical protein